MSRGQATRVSRALVVVLVLAALLLAAQTNQLDTATTFKITPLRPVAELRAEALKQSPPKEERDFLPTDLVELNKLDPTIKLDIRYATANNFMGTPMYTQARAFLQRPAAQAVARANQKLHALGYGL